MSTLARSMIGSCGEHFVASYLSGLGLVVALTKYGTPTTDIIVTSEMGGRSISLQVKSGGPYTRVTYKRKPENNYWVWRTGAKAISVANEAHWFAFVYVGEWPRIDGEFPKIFFVPSKAVAKTLRDNGKSQQDWFWMNVVEAEQYAGVKGFRRLADYLFA